MLSLMVTGCGSGETADEPITLVPASQLKQTDVLPTATSKLDSARNYVYCATMQIAWDKLRDQFGKDPIELQGGSEFATALNTHRFDQSHLSPDSFLAMAGRTDQGIVDRIRDAMAKRFPDATLSMPPIPTEAGICIYTYLFKKLTFAEPFTRSPSPLTFQSGDQRTKVTAFGNVSHNSSQERALARQVSVFDYRGREDFIVRLHTNARNEHLILAKVRPQSTLAATIADVEERIAAERKRTGGTAETDQAARQMSASEPFGVPDIRLGVGRTYSELENKVIENSGPAKLRILQAEQDIKFSLDERGAIVESQVTVTTTKSTEVEGMQPRTLIFDKPFLLYMKETDTAAPYFAIWVGNDEVLSRL